MNLIQSNIYNKLLTFLVVILLSSIFLKFLSTPISCVVMGLIIVLCILMAPQSLISKTSIGLIVFLVIALLYQILGNGEAFNNYLYKSLRFLTGLLLTINLHKFTKKQLRFLLFILLLLFSLSIILTFSILLVDPMAVRYYGYGVENVDIQTKASSLFGMYSYGVGETFAFMMPSLLCFALGSKSVIFKLVLLAIVMLGIITQFMAALTTSFFLSFGGAILVLFFYFKKAKIKDMLISISLLIPLVIYFAPTISNFENVQIIAKMNDIQRSVDTGQSRGQVQGRSDLYIQSIEAYVSSPIWGFAKTSNSATPSFPIDVFAETSNLSTPTYSIANKTNKLRGNEHGVVSMHTTIFDYLGLYGLFALLLFVPWAILMTKGLKVMPQNIHSMYKISFVALFALLLLKGPVSIGTNFLFSTFLLNLLYYNEYYRTKTK